MFQIFVRCTLLCKIDKFLFDRRVKWGYTGQMQIKRNYLTRNEPLTRPFKPATRTILRFPHPPTTCFLRGEKNVWPIGRCFLNSSRRRLPYLTACRLRKCPTNLLLNTDLRQSIPSELTDLILISTLPSMSRST